LGGNRFSQAKVSALEARAYFLFDGKKKVAKEKATPGSAPGKPGPLRYSAGRAACLNSPAAQTRQADSPRPACVAQRLSRGPVNHPGRRGGREFDFCPFLAVDRNRSFFRELLEPSRLSGPHVARRATQVLAGKGRGLFEGRSPEFRSPRQYRVAQGTRRSRAQNLGSPFLWLLSFGEAKESTPAREAEPQANETVRQVTPQKAHNA
jgi:hypothetical protein